MKMPRKSDEIAETLDAIMTKLDGIESRIDGLGDRVAGLEERAAETEARGEAARAQAMPDEGGGSGGNRRGWGERLHRGAESARAKLHERTGGEPGTATLRRSATLPIWALILVGALALIGAAELLDMDLHVPPHLRP